MSITLARSAGFCFGVNRAIQMVEALANAEKKVCTLGPIIHNPQMVAQLESRGVVAVTDLNEVPPDATLVIRSHGIPKETQQAILSSGLAYEDATCPFVAKIHRIVTKAVADGKIVLIAGDAAHPEVQGILSHCDGHGYVFSSPDELYSLLKKLNLLPNIL